MNSVEYSRLFKTFLPPGEAWPHETDETSAFDGLIRALTVEPARIDAAALLLLDTIIPDNTSADLDAWERLVGSAPSGLTDAERLTRIRGILQAVSAVDQPTLQATIRTLSGYPDAILYHRGRPSFAAGVSGAGDSCGEHGYEWLLELYPNLLSVTPDNFGDWTGFTSGTVVDQQSPVTLAETAVTVNFLSSDNPHVAFTAPAGSEGYCSFWIRPAAACVLTVYFLERDGSTESAHSDITLTPDLWHRIEYRAAVGAGGSSPQIRLEIDATTSCGLSWAVAGIRNAILEAQIEALTQIHTRGVFGIQGEYATLLGQDPMEVCW